MTSKRGNCCELESAESCESVVQHKDMGEVVGDGCTYTAAPEVLSESNVCKNCWVGKDGDTLTGTKAMTCSVFAYRPNQRQQRCILDLFIHNDCPTILQVEMYRPFKPDCYCRDIV